MKTIITLLTILTSLTVFSQTYNAEFHKRKWKIGKEKIIKQNRITRLEGRNNASAITNIYYETLEQSIANLRRTAGKEMWLQEKLDRLIKASREVAIGGNIHILIERPTIDAANMEYFSIIIKDSEDKEELFRKDFENVIPNTPAGNSDLWSNYEIQVIDNNPGDSFNVYIIDKLGFYSTGKYKFLVQTGI